MRYSCIVIGVLLMAQIVSADDLVVGKISLQLVAKPGEKPDDVIVFVLYADKPMVIQAIKFDLAYDILSLKCRSVDSQRIQLNKRERLLLEQGYTDPEFGVVTILSGLQSAVQLVPGDTLYQVHFQVMDGLAPGWVSVFSGGLRTDKKERFEFEKTDSIDVIQEGVIQSAKKSDFSVMLNDVSDSVAMVFSVKEKTPVRLTVYRRGGEEVATLWNGVCLPRDYRFVWDGRDKKKQHVPNGTYFALLQIGSDRFIQWFKIFDTSPMPEDFNFVLKINFRTINTFTQTLSVKLPRMDTTFVMVFDALEKAEIYEKMKVINLWNYPDQFAPPYKDNAKKEEKRYVFHHSSYRLMVQANGKEKRIDWDDANQSEVYEAILLRSLVYRISSMVIKKGAHEHLFYDPKIF